MLEQQTYNIESGAANAGHQNELKLIISLQNDSDPYSIFYDKSKPQVTKGTPCMIRGGDYTRGQTLYIQRPADTNTTVDVSGYSSVSVEVYGDKPNLHRSLMDNKMPSLNLKIHKSKQVALNNVANFAVNVKVDGASDLSLSSNVENLAPLNNKSGLSIAEGPAKKKSLLAGNGDGTYTTITRAGGQTGKLHVYESEARQNIVMDGRADVTLCNRGANNGGIEILQITERGVCSHLHGQASIPLLSASLVDMANSIYRETPNRGKAEVKAALIEIAYILRNKHAFAGLNGFSAREMVVKQLDIVDKFLPKPKKGANLNEKRSIEIFKDGCNEVLLQLVSKSKEAQLDGKTFKSHDHDAEKQRDIFAHTLSNFTSNVRTYFDAAVQMWRGGSGGA